MWPFDKTEQIPKIILNSLKMLVGEKSCHFVYFLSFAKMLQYESFFIRFK